MDWRWKSWQPQSKDGVNSFGGLGATLIDSLDTLFIMGLDEQFQKAKEWVATSLDFNKNYDASIFETTIRKRFKDKEDERQFIAFALAHAYFGHCWSLKRTYEVWNASLEWPRAGIGYELRAFKVNAQATSTRARKGVLQDEGSHIVEHRELDLIIAHGGSQGEASESSDDSLGNEERGEDLWVVIAVVEATEGHEPGTRGGQGGYGSRGGSGTRPTTYEKKQEKDTSAPLPGGPIDWSLLLSLKDHIATAIRDNVVRRS
ncbi:hypothetical protein Scep_026419 [Stephania cephalantha]|uniref:Alpha-1,2-Mannosidase n=1 Tax=Stephania cephalantha TaxID=152367 RepID=A0AAP0HTA8_9MAGN